MGRPARSSRAECELSAPPRISLDKYEVEGYRDKDEEEGEDQGLILGLPEIGFGPAHGGMLLDDLARKAARRAKVPAPATLPAMI